MSNYIWKAENAQKLDAEMHVYTQQIQEVYSEQMNRAQISENLEDLEQVAMGLQLEMQKMLHSYQTAYLITSSMEKAKNQVTQIQENISKRLANARLSGIKPSQDIAAKPFNPVKPPDGYSAFRAKPEKPQNIGLPPIEANLSIYPDDKTPKQRVPSEQPAMEIKIDMMTEKRLAATYNGLQVYSQGKVEGGADHPEPYDYFVISIALCNAHFARTFCQARDIDCKGLKVTTSMYKKEGSDQRTFSIFVALPDHFPAKYHRALISALKKCTVKKTIEAGPIFDYQLVV